MLRDNLPSKFTPKTEAVSIKIARNYIMSTVKFFSNRDIAKLLREIAAAYTVKNGDYFKIVAYNSAADSIEHAASELKDLWEDGQLDKVPGVGKSIQGYLVELFKTGRVAHFEEIKKDIPQAMFSLLDLVGMGPKTAYKLTTTLKINNIKDLENAAKAGKIRNLPTFGIKSEQDILAAISEYSGKSQRYDLPTAFNVASRVIDFVKKCPGIERIEPLGSLRRMVATIGDIDIAVSSNNPKEVLKHFGDFREIGRVVNSGESASSAILKNGIRVDVKVQPPEAFGSLLQHQTGSKYHNIKLREYALKKGMSLSEYGIKCKGKVHKFSNEIDFYKFLGLDYIEPELREDSGEIEAALNHKLPKLISVSDIRGDLHIHSNYPIEPSHDLGTNGMNALVVRAKELKYEYIGLSDHSPGFSTHTTEQIVSLIKKRSQAIEQLKTSNEGIRILNLLEIDILTDARLSVPDEGLDLLDGAIAGIHSSHGQNKELITKRLLNAIKHPKVKVISHPTGRLIGERESYEADWPTVFKECAKTNTFLEINSWPARLDLPDTLVREAKSYGVKFVTSTDAHDLAHMDNMKFGVSVARRGWCTKEDIINARTKSQFQEAFGL